MKHLLLVAVLVFSIFFTACSSKEHYPSLANRGILPLSTTNAYLGSNLFLSREAEDSLYLFDFLKARGAPAAIEITDKSFEEPRMNMFYKDKNEMYIGVREVRNKRKSWVIRGPFGLDRHQFRSLNQIAQNMEGDNPLFVIWGREIRFQPKAPESPSRVLQPIVPPPSKRAPARVAKAPSKKKTPSSASAAKKQPSSSEKLIPADPLDFRPQNTDQLAIYMSQGFAERDAQGNLIHTVSERGESLTMIAKWYTKAEENVEEVAKVNGFPPDSPLTAGTRVHIPLKLLKELKPMPPNFGAN